jgi:hypothetical protein
MLNKLMNSGGVKSAKYLHSCLINITSFDTYEGEWCSLYNAFVGHKCNWGIHGLVYCQYASRVPPSRLLL